jgi:hypothetical protein
MRSNERTGRVRGEMVMKPIASITRDVIRDFMINKVLPAIRSKWPREDVGRPIFIQQDNAPSHLKLDDPEFCAASMLEGFDIRLICQPPNSPDFNILDLGFFRAIQAIQYTKDAKTIETLVPAVEEVNQYKKRFKLYTHSFKLVHKISHSLKLVVQLFCSHSWSSRHTVQTGSF